jgi:imidazolonepropionase-like amidohydrolase
MRVTWPGAWAQDRIAAQGASVIYRSRPWTMSVDTLRLSQGSVATLTAAGVPCGIAVGDADNSRNLRWEAGFAVAAGLPYEGAIAAVTSRVAAIFGLPPGVGAVRVGAPANIAVFSGDPLALSSAPLLVAVGPRVTCGPAQL